MTKKKPGEIHVHVHIDGLSSAPRVGVRGATLPPVPAESAVKVTIAEPEPGEAVSEALEASGTTVPLDVILAGLLVVKDDPTIRFAGTVTQGSDPGPWKIDFGKIKVAPGTELILYVWALDPATGQTGVSAVEVMRGE